VPDTVELAVRLSVPRVLLVGLGDADRYRGARLPLGIARLAQWLRYTHTATVDVLDYSLTEAPEVRVADLLATRVYEVLGVSVNFGQWSMLEGLAAVVNALATQPLVVLGNILAAFSPAQAAKPFDAATVLIGTGLGERPLQQLLANLDEPESWARIDGLIRPDATGPAQPAVVPPDLVFPDDELVFWRSRSGAGRSRWRPASDASTASAPSAHAAIAVTAGAAGRPPRRSRSWTGWPASPGNRTPSRPR